MTRPHAALVALARTGEVPSIGADLEAVVASAREHRMTGLLQRALGAGASATLDEHVATTQAWHARLWEALDEAVARLDAVGIQPVTFKGVTAEARWYDGVGDRPCGDVDLLLGPADVARADEAIAALEPGHPLAGGAGPWVDRGILEAVTLTIDGVRIDLHVDPLKLGVPCRQREVVVGRSEELALPGGATVRVLDPSMALVVYLLHLTKDRFRYLLGYVDVQRVLDRSDVDWDVVGRFLHGEGLTEPAGLALRAVGEVLERPVPALATGRGLRSRVWQFAWRPDIRLRGSEGRRRFKKRQELLPLLATGRLGEGIVHGWRVLAPPRALYEVANPGEQGGYLRRLALSRPRRYWQRRRAPR